jgi:hypothetical protein
VSRALIIGVAERDISFVALKSLKKKEGLNSKPFLRQERSDETITIRESL